MMSSPDCQEAANKIDEAANFLVAIYMAADAMDADHSSALKEVSGAAIDRLNLARTSLLPHEAATCTKRIGDRG